MGCVPEDDCFVAVMPGVCEEGPEVSDGVLHELVDGVGDEVAYIWETLAQECLYFLLIFGALECHLALGGQNKR